MAVWCIPHLGSRQRHIEGNLAAEELARHYRPSYAREGECCHAHCDLQTVVHEQFERIADIRWESTAYCKISRMTWPRRSDKRSVDLYKFNPDHSSLCIVIPNFRYHDTWVCIIKKVRFACDSATLIEKVKFLWTMNYRLHTKQNQLSHT